MTFAYDSTFILLNSRAFQFFLFWSKKIVTILKHSLDFKGWSTIFTLVSPNRLSNFFPLLLTESYQL